MSSHHLRSTKITKKKDEDPEDECWYMFNDSSVGKSKFLSFSAITKSFSKDVAYILFYKRKYSENGTMEAGMVSSQ